MRGEGRRDDESGGTSRLPTASHKQRELDWIADLREEIEAMIYGGGGRGGGGGSSLRIEVGEAIHHFRPIRSTRIPTHDYSCDSDTLS